MERIYPITEEQIKSCIGKPVCAVLQDGSCFQGIIDECKDGKIYFSTEISNSSASGKKRKKNAGKKRSRDVREKIADVNGWGYPGYYPGYGGRTFALDLALIVLLFTIPFIGFPIFI